MAKNDDDTFMGLKAEVAGIMNELAMLEPLGYASADYPIGNHARLFIEAWRGPEKETEFRILEPNNPVGSLIGDTVPEKYAGRILEQFRAAKNTLSVRLAVRQRSGHIPRENRAEPSSGPKPR